MRFSCFEPSQNLEDHCGSTELWGGSGGNDKPHLGQKQCPGVVVSLDFVIHRLGGMLFGSLLENVKKRASCNDSAYGLNPPRRKPGG